MPIYQLIPQDLLFFGNAGLAASEIGAVGLSADWPAPSVVFDALHAALHRAYPQVQLWEQIHSLGKNGYYPNPHERPHRFGSLATAGPFPCREQQGDFQWLFQCPGDVIGFHKSSLQTLRPLTIPGGKNNLPQPLLYPLGQPGLLLPATPAPWWNKTALEAYLKNTSPTSVDLAASSDLFGSEWLSHRSAGSQSNDGVPHALRITHYEDKNPNTASAQSIERSDTLHSPPFLRLHEGVSLGVSATLPITEAGGSEGLEKLFAGERRKLSLGGKQRLCHLRTMPSLTLEQMLPVSETIPTRRLKWLLLSPAIYPLIHRNVDGQIRPHPGGWLPNWICPDSGRVLLKKGDTLRRNQGREDWRRHLRALPSFECRLVAARIPKPCVISGWSERRHLEHPASGEGPKPTYLAVPAGAVYYFEGPDVALLAEALSWHGPRIENQFFNEIVNRRSTLLGEKGFGLGVCGPWD